MTAKIDYEKEIQRLEEELKRLKDEDTRLCNVIDDLHQDIRKYNKKVKRQAMIINCQNDIICAYAELVGLIDKEE